MIQSEWWMWLAEELCRLQSQRHLHCPCRMLHLYQLPSWWLLPSSHPPNLFCFHLLSIHSRALQFWTHELNWQGSSEETATCCAPLHDTRPFRFLSSRVCLTFDNFVKTITAAFRRSWVADGSRGPCVNGAAVNCFVCARLCSFDPSGPCGKLQLNWRMPKNGRARRGGRKGWRQGEGKREETRRRQVPVLQQCRSEGEGCQWDERGGCWLITVLYTNGRQCKQALLEPVLSKLTSLCSLISCASLQHLCFADVSLFYYGSGSIIPGSTSQRQQAVARQTLPAGPSMSPPSPALWTNSCLSWGYMAGKGTLGNGLPVSSVASFYSELANTARC